MQSLYGLQELGLTFELKGGTSLSRAIHHQPFSEDLDIRIEPPASLNVKTGASGQRRANREPQNVL